MNSRRSRRRMNDSPQAYLQITFNGSLQCSFEILLVLQDKQIKFWAYYIISNFAEAYDLDDSETFDAKPAYVN
jgi:hypothetical protein